MADDDDISGSVVERFKTAYLAACERKDIPPVESLMQGLDDAIENNEAFTSIVIKGNAPEQFSRRLEDADIEALVSALRSNPGMYVKELDFSWNNIRDQGVAEICQFIKEDDQISSLNIAYNEITEEGATLMAEALMINRSLHHLILSGNKVGDKGGLALAEMMKKNYALRTAELGNMDLGHKTLTMIGSVLVNDEASGMASESNLVTLNIDRPVLFSCQEESIEHIAMGLKLNTTLRSLSLKNAGLRDKGCYLLCDNLVLNGSLTSLDISSNKLTEDAGPSLAKLVHRSGTLASLFLANNELCDRGCTSLSEALSSNSAITDLDLAHNRIGSEGLLQLASAIQQHARLARLRAWGNALQPQSTAALAYACQQLKTLRECDVLCQIVDEVPHAVRKITPQSYYVPGTV